MLVIMVNTFDVRLELLWMWSEFVLRQLLFCHLQFTILQLYVNSLWSFSKSCPSDPAPGCEEMSMDKVILPPNGFILLSETKTTHVLCKWLYQQCLGDGAGLLVDWWFCVSFLRETFRRLQGFRVCASPCRPAPDLGSSPHDTCRIDPSKSCKIKGQRVKMGVFHILRNMIIDKT